VPVEVRDRGYDALMRRVIGLKPVTIATGMLAKDGAQPKKGARALSLIEVAVWNHFGVASKDGGWRIPPRRFISDWFDSEEPKLRAMLPDLFRQVIAGKLTREQALERMGLYCVGQIQQRIANRAYAKNAKSTEDRKHSSTPLVHTGQLRASISFDLREGGASHE
jgi:hypothetical protein